jgi:hypothetical protein
VYPVKLHSHETLELRLLKRSNGAHRSIFCRSVGELIEESLKYAQEWEVYFGVATRLGDSGGKKRDVYRIRTVWCDLDDRTVEECSLFDPAPSILVNSGGGVHAYWAFPNPVLVNHQQRWEDIEAINRGIAERFSGGDDKTIDIARILRVPGTLNHKYDPEPRAVGAYEI